MNDIRCKQIIDSFKDDIQIEYEVNKTINTKTFRVSSLNPIGQRIIHEEFIADINNHKAISSNYSKALDLFNKLIAQYYGKFHNRIKEGTKE